MVEAVLKERELQMGLGILKSGDSSVVCKSNPSLIQAVREDGEYFGVTATYDMFFW